MQKIVYTINLWLLVFYKKKKTYKPEEVVTIVIYRMIQQLNGRFNFLSSLDSEMRPLTKWRKTITGENKFKMFRINSKITPTYSYRQLVRHFNVATYQILNENINREKLK